MWPIWKWRCLVCFVLDDSLLLDKQSVGVSNDTVVGAQITDLVWLQPIAIDTAESANNNNPEHETIAVDIVVDPLSEQQADVLFCAPEDVRSEQDPEQEPLIYSECSVDLKPVDADFNNESLLERALLESAYWDTHLNSGKNIDIDALYQQYANSGLHYGDSHRLLSRVVVCEAENGTSEALAEIDLQDHTQALIKAIWFCRPVF